MSIVILLRLPLRPSQVMLPINPNHVFIQDVRGWNSYSHILHISSQRDVCPGLGGTGPGRTFTVSTSAVKP